MHRLKKGNQNWESIQEKLVFLPHDVVMETIKRTTQLARYIPTFPMRKHVKSMFQMLRQKRINETVATDTYFSTVTSIEGFYCVQAFYGCTSGTIHTYGMKTKGNFFDRWKYHVKELGAPHTLQQDSSKEQGGNLQGN